MTSQFPFTFLLSLVIFLRALLTSLPSFCCESLLEKNGYSGPLPFLNQITILAIESYALFIYVYFSSLLDAACFADGEVGFSLL